VDKSHAYSPVWQVRSDAWSRLEEAADGLNRPGTPELKESYAASASDLLAQLTPLEPYWAYPGAQQFSTRVSTWSRRPS
jgi:arginine decarboxylase